MRRTYKLVLFIPLLLALLLSSPLYAKSKPKAQEPITDTVPKVVDGDTLKIKHDGQEESKANKKAKKDVERRKAERQNRKVIITTIIFIPENDVISENGSMTMNEIADLLRKYKTDPDVIQFIAGMLEE